MILFFHHFWMILNPFVVFQNPYRRDLNEYYICTNYWRLLLSWLEKVKLFWYILVCDDLTLITWNFVLWITICTLYKRKRKEVCGKISIIICFGKYHPKKFWLGENVNISPWLSLFSSYTIINPRRFRFGAVVFWFLVVFARTPLLHWLTCVVLGCQCQDYENHDGLWFVYFVSDCIVSWHIRISVHDACYCCNPCCSIFGWDTVE